VLTYAFSLPSLDLVELLVLVLWYLLSFLFLPYLLVFGLLVAVKIKWLIGFSLGFS
jgi:hypothetical protein